MPMYDYVCSDGSFVEALRPYGKHSEFTLPSGVSCTLVWRKAPSVDVPLHHQSACELSPIEKEYSRRARDPKDSIEVLEPGMDRDVASNKRDREKKSLEWIDSALNKEIERFTDAGA